MKNIFVPEKNVSTFDKNDMIAYLQNIEIETQSQLFTQKEIEKIAAALFSEYFDNNARPFFLHHFIPQWVESVNYLFRDQKNPRIIELGCGTGTSSILFSLLGANVIGVELDRNCVDLCLKRKKFYQSIVGPLDLSFVNANTCSFPYKEYGPFDGVYSLFAFNMMQPTDILLKRILKQLTVKGKLFITDGNKDSFYNRIIPSRRRKNIWSPKVLKRFLAKNNMRIEGIKTHSAIPPYLINKMNSPLLWTNVENIIHFINLHRFLGVSYTLKAMRVS
jgi:SAM-dependent methyltransferase